MWITLWWEVKKGQCTRPHGTAGECIQMSCHVSSIRYCISLTLCLSFVYVVKLVLVRCLRATKDQWLASAAIMLWAPLISPTSSPPHPLTGLPNCGQLKYELFFFYLSSLSNIDVIYKGSSVVKLLGCWSAGQASSSPRCHSSVYLGVFGLRQIWYFPEPVNWTMCE